MKKLISYLTGAAAVVIVVVSIIAAIVYAGSDSLATLSKLTTSCLSGIGMAIGGCLGGALILRFKSARRLVLNVIKEIGGAE